MTVRKLNTKDEAIAAMAAVALKRGERVVYVTSRSCRIRLVMDRIKKAFYNEYVKSSVVLTYKLRPLCINKYDSNAKYDASAPKRITEYKDED